MRRVIEDAMGKVTETVAVVGVLVAVLTAAALMVGAAVGDPFWPARLIERLYQ